MEPVPAEFRKHFRKHNREVIWVTLFSTLAALIVWGGLYCFFYVVTMLAITVELGVDAVAPEHYSVWFCGSAIVLCLFRAASRGRIIPERLRANGKYLRWLITELAFFPPNLIFAIPGNLSAWVHLNKKHLQAAWNFLRSLDGNKRISLSTAPVLLPDEAIRDRVLVALQITGLIHIIPVQHDWLIALKDETACRFAAGRVRIKTKGRSRKVAKREHD